MNALDDLQAVMFTWAERDFVIEPTLHQRNSHWYRLQLVEKTDDDEPRMFYNQRFDNCVKWTDEKLKDWPDCKRMAHDTWDFKHRKDAEKFITLFHLSWQQ